MKNSPSPINERVAGLVEQFGLSHIAQRTNTPPSTVHRYAKNGKVSADFCQALVVAFPISPTWLLTGEGAKQVTDVSETTSNLAGEMNALVKALRATSKMKLGALTGSENLRRLSELSETVADHKRAQQSVTETIRPVAKLWLKALKDALRRRDRNHASDIADAISRLLSFTDDRDLHREFDRHRALLEYVHGRRIEAVRLQRKNLIAQLVESDEVSDETLNEGFRLLAALSGLGYVEDIRRYATAILALAGKDGRDSDVGRMIESMLGFAEISMGSMNTGTNRIISGYVHRTPANDDTQVLFHAILQLRLGTMSVMAVLQSNPVSMQIAVEVIRYALFHENAKTLGGVLSHLKNQNLDKLGAMQFFHTHAKWVLAELKKNKRRPSEDQLEAQSKTLLQTPLLGAFEVEVFRCQRLRLAKDPTASQALLQAINVLRSMTGQVFPDPVILGVHARNVMALAKAKNLPPRIVSDTKELIQQKFYEGFGMYRDLVNSFGC